MNNKKIKLGLVSLNLVIIVIFIAGTSLIGLANCTTISVGKNASVNGTTIISYNCDCATCPFGVNIVSAKDWEEGDTITVRSWEGEEPGKIAQVSHTFGYVQNIMAVLNEKGVAVGETTCSIDTSTEYGKEVKEVMFASKGLVDYETFLNFVLERASTAREAVQILGDLIETYKWAPIAAENINFADGDEVWIFEVYGHDLWCAFRLADDEVFVSANAARIRHIDFDDKENVMHSPNIISFAIDHGWYDPNSGEPFSPADIYAPNRKVYSLRREWRAFDLIAPSLGLSPHEMEYPQTVVPDKKLTVHDVFKIAGDYYAGTEYDLSKGPAAGPWGNPMRYTNQSGPEDKRDWERSIGLHRTSTFHITEINGNLPDPIKGVAWVGVGNPNSSYITPLSGSMSSLPKCFGVGAKGEDFNRESQGWISLYVQELTTLRYNEAIEDLYAFRDPKLEMLYQVVPMVQEKAAELYESDPDAALALLQNFYYNNALGLFESWKQLGDILFGKYAMGYRYFKRAPYPEWWNEIIGFGYPER